MCFRRVRHGACFRRDYARLLYNAYSDVGLNAYIDADLTPTLMHRNPKFVTAAITCKVNS